VPATPDELFALLDKLGIEHSTIPHPPFFTVEEGRHWHQGNRVNEYVTTG